MKELIKTLMVASLTAAILIGGSYVANATDPEPVTAPDCGTDGKGVDGDAQEGPNDEGNRDNDEKEASKANDENKNVAPNGQCGADEQGDMNESKDEGKDTGNEGTNEGKADANEKGKNDSNDKGQQGENKGDHDDGDKD